MLRIPSVVLKGTWLHQAEIMLLHQHYCSYLLLLTRQWMRLIWVVHVRRLVKYGAEWLSIATL